MALHTIHTLIILYNIKYNYTIVVVSTTRLYKINNKIFLYDGIIFLT